MLNQPKTARFISTVTASANRLTSQIFAAVFCNFAMASPPVDYANDVYPIFEAYCIGCHTEDEAQGGLVIESFNGLMAGGDSGLAITPGGAKSSRLYLMAAGELQPVMPPDDAQGLSEAELSILATWIDQGATGPDGDMPIKRSLRTPSIAAAEKSSRPITAIAAHQSTGLTATASFGVVEIRDANNRLVQKIAGDVGKVHAVQFSRDGRRVLLASGLTGVYGSASIHRIADGKRMTELLGHDDTLYDAVWSPDESLVATAGYDHDIRLWDAASGSLLRTFEGHNGAVYDLDFSPDGRHLVSACADQTAKVWEVQSGRRMDTLSQPEAEVYAAKFSPDGNRIIIASGDNRIRVYDFVSRDRPRINPIVATRFVDESAVVAFAWLPDGSGLVTAGATGNLKLIRADDFAPVAELEPAPDAVTGLVIDAAGKRLKASLMSGIVIEREIPRQAGKPSAPVEPITPVYLSIEPVSQVRELVGDDATIQSVPRNAVVAGCISQPGQIDQYTFDAHRGEVWMIQADPANGSPVDPVVAIVDRSGQPVIRTRLQAVRDTYFTFRGKDSQQSNDFRIFNWQEIGLNEYLYAAGEVTRTFMSPRGADSGFDVYPGAGKRHTFFGTSHITHALGDPAYVVRQLRPGESPQPNGLPVFDIAYRNDDDPTRVAGRGSRLEFTAPDNDRYTVAITDTRDMGGNDFDYQLHIRPAEPDYAVSVKDFDAPLLPGTGRELEFTLQRIDGFSGPVTLTASDLPAPLQSSFPVTVQAEQHHAVGNLWLPADAESLEPATFEITASANIHNRTVQKVVGTIGPLSMSDRPPVAVPVIKPRDDNGDPIEVADHADFTLDIQPGETVSLLVQLRRTGNDRREVRFGKEDAARNAVHGVFVDNIGLSGLLVLEGMDEREFFITADPVAAPGPRRVHLKTNLNNGVTSHWFTVNVITN